MIFQVKIFHICLFYVLFKKALTNIYKFSKIEKHVEDGESYMCLGIGHFREMLFGEVLKRPKRCPC